MGFFRWIGRLFGLSSDQPASAASQLPREEFPSQQDSSTAAVPDGKPKPVGIREGKALKHPLPKLRYETSLVRTPSSVEVSESPVPPYRFARFGPFRDTFLDLSKDADPGWLTEFGLPELRTPDDLAEFLGIPLGELAWLVHRCNFRGRPTSLKNWHYTAQWLPKRSGGHRLLEVPKPKLKAVQQKILTEILNRVPPHRTAHGFVRGKSALTNADKHVGAAVVYKIDLENFYGTVRLARVVTIFRTIGFSREVAMWLGQLTTSLPPYELRAPGPIGCYAADWTRRHLPQGAPTSPALANLSAYSLDVRIAGLAKKYKATYTRYADDLTISGSASLISGLRQLIPLAERIVRDERFRVNRAKRRVLRRNQRMTVTGIVVNDHLNMNRRDFDRLKAILHNCVTQGPHSQNRDSLPDFEAHLRGRVEYACQLNPEKGRKLRALLERIRWQ